MMSRSNTRTIRTITNDVLSKSCHLSKTATISSLITTNTFHQSNLHRPHIQPVRSKHSNRQVKRLFKQHPGFHRISERNDTAPKKYVTPPPTLKYEPIFDPIVVLHNGWSQPPDDEDILKKRDLIPFGVKRTGNKPNGAVGFLPVYSNFKYVQQNDVL